MVSGDFERRLSMVGKMRKAGTVFELLGVEAWAYYDEWTYNQTWTIGRYTCRGKDEKRAFLRALKKHNAYYKARSCRVDETPDWSLELVVKKTGEPLFTAIPIEEIEA